MASGPVAQQGCGGPQAPSSCKFPQTEPGRLDEPGVRSRVWTRGGQGWVDCSGDPDASLAVLLLRLATAAFPGASPLPTGTGLAGLPPKDGPGGAWPMLADKRAWNPHRRQRRPRTGREVPSTATGHQWDQRQGLRNAPEQASALPSARSGSLLPETWGPRPAPPPLAQTPRPSSEPRAATFIHPPPNTHLIPGQEDKVGPTRRLELLLLG